MKKMSMRTEACFPLNGIDVVAYIHYTYFREVKEKRKEEPDFQIKNIALTFDGVVNSPLIETEGELFFDLVENDKVIEAVYHEITNFEIEMDSRSEA
jgi:hypothetical protein